MSTAVETTEIQRTGAASAVLHLAAPGETTGLCGAPILGIHTRDGEKCVECLALYEGGISERDAARAWFDRNEHRGG